MKIDKGIDHLTFHYGAWTELEKKMGWGDSVLLKNTREAFGLISAIKRKGGHALRRKDGDGYRVWKLKKTKKK